MHEIFPIRPQPSPQESLTSFLLRVCHRNGISADAFHRQINNKYKGRYLDSNSRAQLDVNPSIVIDMQHVSMMTGVSIQQLESMSFNPVASKLSDGTYETVRELMRGTVLLKYRRFCRLCLKKYGYYKLVWQVKEIEICDEHYIKLESSCQQCNKPQSYWTSATSKMSCTSCQAVLYETSTREVVDSSYINSQLLLYKDWYYLLDSVSFVKSKYKNQEIAIKLLYVLQDSQNIFDPTKIRVLDNLRISRLIRFIQSKNDKYHVTLNLLLKSLRQITMTLEEFAQVHVSDEFKNSLLNYHSKFYRPGPCLAPWCPTYGTNEQMKPINLKAVRFRRETFSHPFVCKSCYMKYGYRKSTNEWSEAGEFINLGWEQALPNLRQGLALTTVSRILKVSRERVFHIAGYFAYRGLLTFEGRELTVLPDGAMRKFRNLSIIKKGRSWEQQAQELYGWDSLQYWSVYFSNVIQDDLLFNFSRQKQGARYLVKGNEWKAKVEDEIHRRLKERLPISNKEIAAALDCSTRLLHRHGFQDLFKTARSKAIQRDVKEYLIQAEQYLLERGDLYTDVSFSEFCRFIGRSKRWTQKFLPGVATRIRQEMERKYRERRITAVQESVQGLKEIGETVTVTAIIQAMGQNKSNVYKYPEIIDAIKRAAMYPEYTPTKETEKL